MRFLHSSRALLRFYLDHLSTLYNLPDALKNPDVLSSILAEGRAFELKVPAASAKEYNNSLQALASRLRTSSSLDSSSPDAFRQNLFWFFSLRIVCCCLALAGSSWQLCLAVASLQFVLLPHSIFVSVTQLIALFPPLFSGHLFVHLPLQLLSDYFFPFLPCVTISPPFILAFFIVDFIQAIFPHQPSPAHASPPKPYFLSLFSAPSAPSSSPLLPPLELRLSHSFPLMCDTCHALPCFILLASHVHNPFSFKRLRPCPFPGSSNPYSSGF